MTARQIMQRARAIVGSNAALCRAIQYSDGAVHRAIERNRISAEMAVNLEVATGGQITRLQIRPDLFGPSPKLLLHAWRD